MIQNKILADGSIFVTNGYNIIYRVSCLKSFDILAKFYIRDVKNYPYYRGDNLEEKNFIAKIGCSGLRSYSAYDDMDTCPGAGI